MNLVVLTKQFGNYTGATISTIELLKRISSEFEKVTVLTLKSDGTKIQGVQVQKAKSYLDLIQRLKKKRNVIGYSDDHLGFLFSFFNIKYVHTYHGNWPDARKLNFNMFIKSFYFIPLYKQTIREASIVINVSNYMKEKFVNSLNSCNKTIYNGIKQDEQDNFKDSQLVKENNTNSGYLMVGNIDKRKYGKAIKIFNELKSRSFQGVIDIYGGLFDRKLVSELQKFTFVNVKGVVNKINYKDYDALICTSASENLPVSIVESIINGIPVITSNVGGISEIIMNKKNGYLINVNDYHTFANVILHHQNLIIDSKSKERIRSIFSWDTSSNIYMSIFKKVGESINEDNYSRTNTRQK